jgi:pseudouridylate synthase
VAKDQSPIQIDQQVAAALATDAPVVALETAVLTHGLPRPLNLETSLAMEAEVRDGGAIPATVGIVDGAPIVGLSADQLRRLANDTGVAKASLRDLSVLMATGRSAGTTVAATAWLAHRAGIRVFVTGGIGGVHQDASTSFDISTDLPTLAQTPIVIVCSGAKSVLDLPATLEWLETAGVPVVGYQTDELPGFVVRETGLRLIARADDADTVAAMFRAQRRLGLSQALVVVVPPPAESAVAADLFESWRQDALAELARQRISGKEVTPFLLNELERRSGGVTLRANVALLRQNARVGAAIGRALAEMATL